MKNFDRGRLQINNQNIQKMTQTLVNQLTWNYRLLTEMETEKYYPAQGNQILKTLE